MQPARIFSSPDAAKTSVALVAGLFTFGRSFMPDRFPQEAVMRDGKRVLIRPFTQADVDDLFEFFGRLPPDVRRFAWDNIEDRSS